MLRRFETTQWGESVMDYGIFRDLAIILLAGKYMGLLARRLNAPQVAGEILAGLLIGPCMLGFVQPSEFITQMAGLGVVLLMFNAGLDSNIEEIKRSGLVSFLIAMSGVLLPLAAGTGLYLFFYGFEGLQSDTFYHALFMGCILTATSVSITVQALRELGHLKTKVGTTILSAAIIDDILGILVLTIVSTFKDPSASISMVLVKTGGFFLFCLVSGYLIYLFFKDMSRHHPHTRRLTVIGLSYCLLMSFIAEEWFGIADITGAYVAGLVLSNLKDASYIENRLDINSYTIFAPVFFASVGISTDISNFDLSILWFSLAFLVVGLLSKVVGCGVMARLCHFSSSDSLKIGVGMMNRGEVALIVAQKGLAIGLMSASYFPAVILLIIVSAVVTPIILKVLYEHAFQPSSVVPSTSI